jgi:hypothetical protein
VADRLFEGEEVEGEEAVLHVMGWVGGRAGPPIFVTPSVWRPRGHPDEGKTDSERGRQIASEKRHHPWTIACHGAGPISGPSGRSDAECSGQGEDECACREVRVSSVRTLA